MDMPRYQVLVIVVDQNDPTSVLFVTDTETAEMSNFEQAKLVALVMAGKQ